LVGCNGRTVSFVVERSTIPAQTPDYTTNTVGTVTYVITPMELVAWNTSELFDLCQSNINFILPTNFTFAMLPNTTDIIFFFYKLWRNNFYSWTNSNPAIGLPLMVEYW
jgi:hypothetical protein